MIDFVGKRKIFFIISIALVAVTLLGSLFMGLNLDIQYKGGTMLTYSYSGDINKDEFLSKVQEIVGGTASIQEPAGFPLTSRSSFPIHLPRPLPTTTSIRNLSTMSALPLDGNSS